MLTEEEENYQVFKVDGQGVAIFRILYKNYVCEPNGFAKTGKPTLSLYNVQFII